MTSETTLDFHKLIQGDTYTAGRGVTLNNGEVASVTIENPDGTGATLVLNFQRVTVSAGSTGVYYRNADVSGGTESGTANDLIGNADTSIANVYYDGTPSNADATTTFPLTDANGPTNSGLAERPPVALQPGTSITIEVTSDADGNGVLFLFTFYETNRSD